MTMKIKGGHQAIFQMDTRVTCNVIRAGELRGTKYEPKVAQMNQVLKTYNSSPLRPVRKCLIQLTNLRNGKKYIVEFVVVKDNDADANLLGSMAAQQMNLIQVNHENLQPSSSEVVHAVDPRARLACQRRKYEPSKRTCFEALENSENPCI